MSTVLTVSTQRIGRCYLHPWWYFIFVHCQCHWAPNCCQYSCQPTLKLSASLSTCWQLNPESIFSFRTKYDIPRSTGARHSYSGPNKIKILSSDALLKREARPWLICEIEHYSLSWSSDSLECLTLLWCISIILPFVGQVAKVRWKSRNVWFHLE